MHEAIAIATTILLALGGAGGIVLSLSSYLANSGDTILNS